MTNLIFWISILGIFLLWTKLFKRFFLDLTRFHLFQIRNKLFNLVSKHDALSYNSGIYTNLENKINLYIRFCHEVDLLKMFVLSEEQTTQNNTSFDFLSKEISNLEDVNLRKSLEKIFIRFQMTIILHLILSSLILVTIGLLPIFIASIWFLITNKFLRVVNYIINKATQTSYIENKILRNINAAIS